MNGNFPQGPDSSLSKKPETVLPWYPQQSEPFAEFLHGNPVHQHPVVLKPKAVVIMGGLSMPNVPVKAEQVKGVIDRHPGSLVIGVCFMHMFEKAGWLNTLSFEYLPDANIDPVEVEKKG